MANQKKEELKNDEGSEVVENKTEESKVEVTKSDLESLVKRIEDQSRTIDLLIEASDKSRLAKANEQSGRPLIRTVRVLKFPETGKLVIGWKSTFNQCEIINGRWVEDQRTLVMFDDGTSKEITLLDFYRKMVGVKAEVVSSDQTVDEKTGKINKVLKVRFEDGRELQISELFINN